VMEDATLGASRESRPTESLRRELPHCEIVNDGSA
jgi:hypothetical protein